MPANHNVIRRKKLAKIKLKLTVVEYNKDFLLTILICHDVSDAENLGRYIRGLKINFRNELQIRKISNLKNGMNLAEKLHLI